VAKLKEADLPGVPENGTLGLDPYQATLESYGYMQGTPYPRPLVIGQTGIRNAKWVGYRNILTPMKTTDDRSNIVPKIPINPLMFNASIPRPTNATFSGQAPIRGIFTGVTEDS
jgi:hypothetical protein